MDAHCVGAGYLFFMPWQGATLRRPDGRNPARYNVVALIGWSYAFIVNHYNYAY